VSFGCQREKAQDPDHPETLGTMKNLALGYGSQKRYDEAAELFEHVLARERTLCPDHIDTLTTVHNLAIIYRLQRKYCEAEDLFKRALVGWEKQLDRSHPSCRRMQTIVFFFAPFDTLPDLATIFLPPLFCLCGI
jgi:Tfp pilus assembly protein PilF